MSKQMNLGGILYKYIFMEFCPLGMPCLLLFLVTAGYPPEKLTRLGPLAFFHAWECRFKRRVQKRSQGYSLKCEIHSVLEKV